MTSLRADAYGVVYFTPNQLIDLSQGEATIRFDLSTERMSTRDWVDVWVTPWAENLALPLEESDPDLQGAPRNSIQITTHPSEGSPILLVTRDGQQIEFEPGWAVPPIDKGIVPGTNEAAVRQPFQLTLSATRARFERLASATGPNIVFWDEAIDFSFPSAVVQFGHHSYNPTKDNAGTPGTWHWDNIEFSNSIPFTVIRANQRYADPMSKSITFDRPAPDDASLRFSAIGIVELSFDGGRTWSTAKRQDGLGQRDGDHHPEHFSSYWTAIPSGAMSAVVRFRADGWYSGPYLAQGFSIWAP